MSKRRQPKGSESRSNDGEQDRQEPLGLWEISTHVRALGELMRCATELEAQISDDGWHGLGEILIRCADGIKVNIAKIDAGEREL